MRTWTLPSILILTAGLGVALVHGADLPSPEASNPAPGLSTGPAVRLGVSAILPPDSAFALQALPEADRTLLLMWEMPAGYYLYQKSLKAEAPDGSLIPLELPEATPVTDEYFGAVAVYYDRLMVRIAPEHLTAAPGAALELLLSYQGCAENLYCYPPQQKALSIALPE